MILVKHRINTIDKLKKSGVQYGIEIDVRSYNKKIILNHEPLENGVKFISWCKYFNHKILIINIKEEGLEEKILKILTKYRIKNFFFLDQSFPFLIKKKKIVKKRTALRYSNFESLKTCILNKNYANWIWIDLFGFLKLNIKEIKLLKKNFKVCLASPELSNSISKKKLNKFIQKYKSIAFDAVCTKDILSWTRF